ncbi:hypothetical protein VARIO8X_160037 [Burkholderiales bacterium 8X]|nr:hypothetical protein VARIO8X_160037 [Burkholderiales bacterium 8X]
MTTLSPLLAEFCRAHALDGIPTYEDDQRAYLLIGPQTVVLALSEEHLCIQALRVPRKFDDDTAWADQSLEPEQVTAQQQVGDELWTLVAPLDSRSSLLQVDVPVAGLTPQRVNELIDSFAARNFGRSLVTE